MAAKVFKKVHKEGYCTSCQQVKIGIMVYRDLITSDIVYSTCRKCMRKDIKEVQHNYRDADDGAI